MTAPVACLRGEDGWVLPARGDRWTADADHVDRRILDGLAPPVLDVGCGPGRHVVALAEQGVPALGIDVTPAALDLARQRGAAVLERSIFGRVPGAGRWPSAILLDGNLGIGGQPAGLLTRVASLLRSGGRILVESGAPGTGGVVETVRLELDGTAGPWFDWASIGADDMPPLAATAGLAVVDERTLGGRWFSVLETP